MWLYGNADTLYELPDSLVSNVTVLNFRTKYFDFTDERFAMSSSKP